MELALVLLAASIPSISTLVNPNMPGIGQYHAEASRDYVGGVLFIWKEKRLPSASDLTSFLLAQYDDLKEAMPKQEEPMMELVTPWTVEIMYQKKQIEDYMPKYVEQMADANLTQLTDIGEAERKKLLNYGNFPRVVVYFDVVPLASVPADTDWTSYAATRTNSNDVRVIDVVHTDYNDSPSQAFIKSAHQDTSIWKTTSPLPGNFSSSKLHKQLANEITKKVIQLIHSCRCLMFNDGLCYFYNTRERSWTIRSMDETKMRCVKLFYCRGKNASREEYKVLCSGDIKDGCNMSHCIDRCNAAKRSVMIACNATCAEGSKGVEQVKFDLRFPYDSCKGVGEVTWRSCYNANSTRCKGVRARGKNRRTAGLTMLIIGVVIVVFLAVGAVIAFFFVKIRRGGENGGGLTTSKGIQPKSK